MHIGPNLNSPIHQEENLHVPASGSFLGRDVHPCPGDSYTSHGQTPPASEYPSFDQRVSRPWSQLPVEQTEDDIFLASKAIFDTPRVTLSFTDLQTANQRIDPANRVVTGESAIAGQGVFASRAFQAGEVIGFYTGSVALRKAMPETLIRKYLSQTRKKLADIALPLQAVWYSNPSGDIQYSTQPGTYIAWSQVKIYRKGIEIGFDGEGSGTPLRYLNHSYQPNTVLIPTLDPESCRHITDQGGLYVDSSANFQDCLLIPVIATRPIEAGEELTFLYSNKVNFDNVGKDIVSNPDEMMERDREGFPRFTRKKRHQPATGWGKTRTRKKKPGQPTASTFESTIPPQGAGNMTHRDLDKEILTPVLYLSENTEEPDSSTSESSAPESMETSEAFSDNPDTDWRELISEPDYNDDPLFRSFDSSDTDETDSEIEDDRPCSSKTSRKRSSHTKASEAAKRRKIDSSDSDDCYRQAGALLSQLTAAELSEYPDLIWQLFLVSQSPRGSLCSFTRCCNRLNKYNIVHNLEGEWTPALLYNFLFDHGKICEEDKYLLMPYPVLRENCLFKPGINPDNEIELFCVDQLHVSGSIAPIINSLNRYGLHQPGGSKWDVESCYTLLQQHTLTKQQLQKAIQGKQQHAVSEILWRHARAGNITAFHMIIHSYMFEDNMSFVEASITLNWRVRRGKGPRELGTEWNQQKLLRYMLNHKLLDLGNPDHRKMISMKLAISELKRPEIECYPMQNPISDDEADALSVEELRERLLYDYLTTDDQQQKEIKLAENILRCLKKELSLRADKNIDKAYHPLVSFLNHNGIQTETLSKWTHEAIYSFMERQGFITPDNKFKVMSFITVKARYKEKNDKAELAAFFHYWLSSHTSNPGQLAYRLRHAGFSFEEEGALPTSNSILTLLNDHNLRLEKQGATATKASAAKASKATNLGYLAVQGKAEDMSNLARHYLIDRKNDFGSASRQIKTTLKKYLAKGETLESQYQKKFGHRVWEVNGLVAFSLAHKIKNINDLPAITAAKNLPDTDLTNYLPHALNNRTAFRFISNRAGREKDKAAFYKWFGEELHTKGIAFPRSPEQIKTAYAGASNSEKEELQGELILQTLQEQANPDASGTPKSLKVLFSIFKTEGCSMNTTHERLKKFCILIPEEADCIPIIGKVKKNAPVVRREGDTRGQAGTSYWLVRNVEKMLNLVDPP